MLWSQGLLSDRQRPFIERLRLSVLALVSVELCQAVETLAHMWMLFNHEDVVLHSFIPIHEALLKHPLSFPSGGPPKFLVKDVTSLDIGSFNFDHLAVILLER